MRNTVPCHFQITQTIEVTGHWCRLKILQIFLGQWLDSCRGIRITFSRAWLDSSHDSSRPNTASRMSKFTSIWSSVITASADPENSVKVQNGDENWTREIPALAWNGIIALKSWTLSGSLSRRTCSLYAVVPRVGGCDSKRWQSLHVCVQLNKLFRWFIS